MVAFCRRVSGGIVMKRSALCAATLAALSISALAALAQPKSGVDKLYILNCGEGVAGDISRWSPGVNVGKSMNFADNCYLIHHTQGWMLWDTGVTDAIASMPDGQAPPDPRMTHWRRPKTLVSQLEQLGVKPADIKYLAVSHTHPDHIGNVELFPQAMLLVQKAEYEWPKPLGVGEKHPPRPTLDWAAEARKLIPIIRRAWAALPDGKSRRTKFDGMSGSVKVAELFIITSACVGTDDTSRRPTVVVGSG